MIVGKELCPLVVDQGAVGLHAVADVLARAPVFLLVLDHAPEKVDPGEHGLAALPAKGGTGLHEAHALADQHLEGGVVHHVPSAYLAIGVGGAVVVKAVGAVQVAVGRGRLDQDARDHGPGRDKRPCCCTVRLDGLC